jgi:hypothetical protein
VSVVVIAKAAAKVVVIARTVATAKIARVAALTANKEL